MCRELTVHGSAAFSSSLIMECSSNARPDSSASPRLPAHLCRIWQWGGVAAGSSSGWRGKFWGFNFVCPALPFRRTLFYCLHEANRLVLFRENVIVFFNEKNKSLLAKQVCLCSASFSNAAVGKAISPGVLIICGAAALLCKQTGL